MHSYNNLFAKPIYIRNPNTLGNVAVSLVVKGILIGVYNYKGVTVWYALHDIRSKCISTFSQFVGYVHDHLLCRQI